jgi:hypothetical protein
MDSEPTVFFSEEHHIQLFSAKPEYWISIRVGVMSSFPFEGRDISVYAICQRDVLSNRVERYIESNSILFHI